ncbi:hypothetical protein ACQY1Q_05170 [Tenacibaculum sp. TC6]|uniref:hypothetical protein n=1 Tax=Tenacibaculum sp. TC6 TaxID=3423223 RepID=UPI003D3610A0
MENLLYESAITSKTDVISGTLKCSTATVFSRTFDDALVLGLANPSSTEKVEYTLYDQYTGHKLSSGSLSPGNSKQITIPATSEMSSYRLQNQSNCGITHTTPLLMYSVVVAD